MNAVGIDVSKGKSIMMALQPMNQVVLKPREYPHTEAGLDQMAHDILRLGEDTRVIMEATGRYHEPVAAALHEHGCFYGALPEGVSFQRLQSSGSVHRQHRTYYDSAHVKECLLAAGAQESSES